MKAIAIDRFGGLDELKMHELPKPEPAAGEVLIRVRASGVGIWDSEQRAGENPPAKLEFPLVPGLECSGDVERVGAGVTTLKPNEPVYTYFNGKQGSYAQYVAVKAEFVARKPSSLSYIEAAGVPVDGITARQAIVDVLKLQSGEWLYVAGGAGGVGSMAVQIAATLGARVIASARADDFAYLESLGMKRANLIDYKAGDVVKAVRDLTNGKGADAALDAVGGDSSKETIRAVRDGGRLAELTGEKLPAERNVQIFHISSKATVEALDALGALFDAGKLKLPENKVFPLAEARDAQKLVEGPHGRNKIVLSVN
jgi:NADPH:quinone reductase-like Zn-dependent oxidoreductase